MPEAKRGFVLLRADGPRNAALPGPCYGAALGQALRRVRLGSAFTTTTNAMFLMPDLLRPAGIDAEVVTVPSLAQRMQAVASGSVDVGSGGLSATMQVATKGLPMTVLANGCEGGWMTLARPGITRFSMTEIALSAAALGQFDDAPVLAAAELLAHAKVDVIAWSGTAAAWRGFDTDEALCRAITAGTGIPATTSVLAMNAALAVSGARRLGLVTPYTADVQQRIMANYATLGLACIAERHFGLRDNFAFAAVAADALEAELEAYVLDSVAMAVWGSLSAAGIDPGRVAGWGRLFQYGAR